MGASQYSLLQSLSPCGELPVSWGGGAREGVVLPRPRRAVLQQGQGRTRARVWARLSARSDWGEFPRGWGLYVDPGGRQSRRTPDDRSPSGPVWPRGLAVIRDRQGLLQPGQSRLSMHGARAAGVWVP